MLAITPFNFTSIAGNLPTAPALLGNVVVWKPSPTQQLSAHYTDAAARGGRAAARRDQPGHRRRRRRCPGSRCRTGTWPASTSPGPPARSSTCGGRSGENIAGYRGYPRLVGETGGKDFVIAHPSADPAVLATALIRGAFEYQGQKCSAASRAYVPRSVWDRMRDDFLAQVEALTVGDVAADLSLFMGAVIDDRAFGQAHRRAGPGQGQPVGDRC